MNDYTDLAFQEAAVLSAGDTIATFDLGAAVSGEPGTWHRVCFSQTSNPTNTDFNVDLGLFSMAGMSGSLIDYKCTMGVACTIQVSGAGLAATNKVRLIDSGSSCGSAALTTHFDTVHVLPDGSTFISDPDVTNAVPYDVFVFGTQVQGTHGAGYRVCWAGDMAGAAWADSDFNVLLGTFTMIGVLTEDHSCTLGLSCQLVTASQTGASAAAALRIQDTGPKDGREVSPRDNSMLSLIHI